jgi:hypothetical protein
MGDAQTSDEVGDDAEDEDVEDLGEDDDEDDEDGGDEGDAHDESARARRKNCFRGGDRTGGSGATDGRAELSVDMSIGASDSGTAGIGKRQCSRREGGGGWGVGGAWTQD